MLLHGDPSPVVDPGGRGVAVSTLRVDDADPALSTLPCMARDALARLPADPAGAGYALAALGTCASTFAQALALELLGRDRRVTCVALVPDAALPAAAARTHDDRLVAAWRGHWRRDWGSMRDRAVDRTGDAMRRQRATGTMNSQTRAGCATMRRSSDENAPSPAG